AIRHTVGLERTILRLHRQQPLDLAVQQIGEDAAQRHGCHDRVSRSDASRSRDTRWIHVWGNSMLSRSNARTASAVFPAFIKSSGRSPSARIVPCGETIMEPPPRCETTM